LHDEEGLMKKVMNSLNTSFDRIVYWSDSTIILNWLKIQPNKLQVFVSNRVVEIQGLTDYHEWRHVPTQENPANLLSRGLYPRQLVREKIWWYGPPFLLKSEHEWPTMPKAEIPTTELKKIVCAVKQVQLVKTFIFDISTNVREGT